jgi:type IX secretion system PorP/SprF family membrane protein
MPAFRQFYFNPYLYNPAFAGTSDYTEISLIYRQQWVGFNDAPSAAGFTIQYPTQNRISVGMNFMSQQTVVLRTTSVQATFAYRLPISETQFLFFGLSGVAGNNDLDLDGVDFSNDPTIMNAASTKFYADANFGMVYQLRNLRFGFALPKLIGQDYYSPRDLVNVRYAQFRNQLYSFSYKFYSGYFSFEPYALYRVNRDLQNWWEVATIVSFKEMINTGVSYHSTQGLGFFVGFEFKEKARLSYSYEIPIANNEFTSTSSHEVQLQLRLGKKRNFRWAARYVKPEQVIAEDKLAAKEESVVTKADTAVNKSAQQNQMAVIPEEKKTVEEPKKTIVEKSEVGSIKPPVQSTLTKGLYVIAGSFKTQNFATAHQKKLIALGYGDVNTGWHPKNGAFYVYVFSSYDLDESRKQLDQFRLKSETSNAWILRIE